MTALEPARSKYRVSHNDLDTKYLDNELYHENLIW